MANHQSFPPQIYEIFNIHILFVDLSGTTSVVIPLLKYFSPIAINEKHLNKGALPSSAG